MIRTWFQPAFYLSWLHNKIKQNKFEMNSHQFYFYPTKVTVTTSLNIHFQRVFDMVAQKRLFHESSTKSFSDNIFKISGKTK